MKAQPITIFLVYIFFSGILISQSCGTDAVLDKSVIDHYTNNLDAISLDISKKDMKDLSEGTPVKVDLFFNGQKKKAKVSLLPNSNTTSYSVQMRGKTALPGIRKFTLVAAENLQDQILDIIYYQLAGYCGLIQLKSELVLLSINGNDLGVYLLKEDYDKCLIERNGFRESVIIRIDKDEVVACNEELIEAGSSFENDFKNARKLLVGFMDKELAPGKVFNLKALGAHFAFANLTGNHEQLLIDNVHFYYNPITTLLEPIPNELGSFQKLEQVTAIKLSINTDWLKLFMKDFSFIFSYKNALEKVSSDQFLFEFFKNNFGIEILNVGGDYLENILGGNHQFIRDFLKTDVLDGNQQLIEDFLKGEILSEEEQNISYIFNGFKNIATIDGVIDKAIKIELNKNITLSESYYVPANSTLVVNEGVEINLIENAALISFSKVRINGSGELPVKIISTDSTGRGFHVITDDSSSVNYLISDNLNAPESGNWTIPSCITFYGGYVKIENSKFLNNNCEDGLNIFRSAYSISDCHFEGSFSDAFDADFSNGIIENSVFKNIGNDAIDISGSSQTLNNITVKNAQDKALSAGENSKIVANNINISNSALAITSKDNSVIELNNSIITMVDVAYAIFQKKPEFGPARVSTKSVSVENCKVQDLIETNSFLIIDGDTLLGKDDQVRAKLYGQEYGKATVK